MLIKRVAGKLRRDGITGLVSATLRRVFPPRLASFEEYRPFVEGKAGLEIGGPSDIFGRAGIIPLYPLTGRGGLDNCTFSQRTIWEGEITEGDTFRFDKHAKPGKQYIIEGSSLDRIGSAAYEFVISSHVLEHLANPLLALSEWLRVLKEDGLFILVLPHKDGTFDHLRPVTSLDHLIQDYEGQVDEGDQSHLEEILKFHDLTRDPGAGDFETFKLRSMKNVENRGLHHHVFDTKLAVNLLNHVGLQILAVELFRPFHIVIVARKPSQSDQNTRADRTIRTEILPTWTSPFPSDR